MYGTRWNVFGQPWWSQFNQLQSEVNRLLDYWGDGQRRGPEAAGYPPVNVWENDDSLEVEVELPGLRMEDLEIYVTGNNQLSLKGQRQPSAADKSVQHRQERTFGSFTRVLELPVAVDANKVEARLENGILKVTLGKQEQAKPRKIVVKG